MQKANRSGLRKKAAAIVALLAMCATTVSGTLAYRDYKQHKSNELNGIQIKHEARLVEDYEEIPDWKIDDPDVKKEIRVANVGAAAAGYGDVYVRLQLKEFMQISEITYVETEKRYMIDEAGQFIAFASENAAKTAYPGHNVANLTDFVTKVSGWFIETQAHDPNGQYGKHVVLDVQFGTANPVIPGSVFCPIDQRNHHGIPNLECQYPIHGWGTPDATALIDRYIEWILGANVIRMSVWDGKPVAAWIIDDEADGNGWAYWGQALAPGETTSNLLEKVRLIDQPDGNFYYVIHVDMEALSIDEFLKPDGDGQSWKKKPGDSYVNNRPTITWNGATPTTVKAGETVQSPGVTVSPAGADQTGLVWSTSNPDIATVDQNGVVTGVKAGGPVTIIVRAKNGARGTYTLNVTPGDPVTIPVTGVTLNATTQTINTGATFQLTPTIAPANATNKNVTWSVTSGSAVTVSQTGLVTAGNSAGTATVTVTTADGGKTASCVFTVTTAVDPDIPTKGTEFDMQGSDTPALNYAVRQEINKSNFANAVLIAPGSVKLSDILASGFNYSGMTVTAEPSALNPTVSIGKDKDNADALLITYYGTAQQWIDAYALPGRPYPLVQMTLVLHKAGYADTTIKINLAFNGTIYG